MQNEIYHYWNLIQKDGSWSMLAFTIIAGFSTFFIKIILNFLTKRLRKFTENTITIWDDIGLDLIDRFKSITIFFLSLHFLTESIHKSALVQKLLLSFLVIIVMIQVTIWGLYIIKNLYKEFLEKQIENDPPASAAIGLLYTGIRFGFITIIFLIALSNLGVDITALVAGLGVGGIAIALAAQNVLGDLIASLSIVLDRPFSVSDFIVIGNEKGTVEHIGIKTTRLRSLSGEELIISNKDLLESRVQNFKRMSARRAVQNLEIIYETPFEVLKKIPTWLEEIISQYPKIRLDRCHFASYGSSSLIFEVVFYIDDPEYKVYMDLQQNVLLDIFKKFSEEKVEFAYPTQTIKMSPQKA
jgi:small-conductance mechanosensitive channel